jgi:flap endonuclease-1
MGIGNLNTLLREHCPQVFVKRPLTDFSGKRIAVDANNWGRRMMAAAHKRNVNMTDVAVEDPVRGTTIQIWLQLVMDDICQFLNYGVTPIIVFDGQHPEKKAQTQKERREQKEKDLEAARLLREELRAMDLLTKNADKIEQLRKIMRRCSYIAREEMDLLKGLLEGIGIPCLYAKGEAEQLCSMLTIEGYAEAAMSADTDNLTYGCPCVITEYVEAYFDPNTRAKVPQVMTVGIKAVLQGLNLSFPSFVDLCIMLGCDYNSNIPQIGTGRAYELIKKFGSIERIPRRPENPDFIDAEECKCRIPKTHTYDVTILDHESCRHLFSKVLSQAICENWTEKLEIQNNLGETGRDILNPANLTHYLIRLVELYRQLPTPEKSQFRPPNPPRLVIVSV